MSYSYEIDGQITMIAPQMKRRAALHVENAKKKARAEARAQKKKNPTIRSK